MLSFAFSIVIIALCVTFVFMLLKFFKSQLKTSYKMVSKFQEDAERLIAEKRELEEFIDALHAKIEAAEKEKVLKTRKAKPNIDWWHSNWTSQKNQHTLKKALSKNLRPDHAPTSFSVMKRMISSILSGRT